MKLKTLFAPGLRTEREKFLVLLSYFDAEKWLCYGVLRLATLMRGDINFSDFLFSAMTGQKGGCAVNKVRISPHNAPLHFSLRQQYISKHKTSLFAAARMDLNDCDRAVGSEKVKFCMLTARNFIHIRLTAV